MRKTEITPSLSPRELQVAQLVEQGYRNQHIAEKLEINDKTVSTYLARLYQKCGLEKEKNCHLLILKLYEVTLLTPQKN